MPGFVASPRSQAQPYTPTLQTKKEIRTCLRTFQGGVIRGQGWDRDAQGLSASIWGPKRLPPRGEWAGAAALSSPRPSLRSET